MRECEMWIVWKVICRKGNIEQARGRCAYDEPASCGERNLYIYYMIYYIYYREHCIGIL